MREAWIRAKYAERQFVQRLPGGGPSPGPVARRWSVRRLRRRPRSSERRPRSAQPARTAPAPPPPPALASSGDGSGGDASSSFSGLIIDGGSGGGTADAPGAGGDRLLVFGDPLPAAAGVGAEEPPLDLSSGESTEGEDQPPLGEKGVACVFNGRSGTWALEEGD